MKPIVSKLSVRLVGLLLFSLCFSASAEEADAAKDILKKMSAEIASLQKFVITGDGYTDARLPAGQIIEHSLDVTLRMSRPDTLRISNYDEESLSEIFFGEGVLSVYREKEGFYAQTELPLDMNAAVDFAINEIGIDAPVLDFVSSDVAGHLLKAAESIDYFGLSRFRGQNHHHIGIRTAENDVQVWVSAEGSPLPRKISISSKWDAGAPRSVYFFDWTVDPGLEPKSLRFVPPEGSSRIEFDLNTAECGESAC
ncbi:MAG: DUF2092 domain-containing protein [Halioglobus sp.]